MDPELWDEPEKFNPSRFLNIEGVVTKPEYFMPCGVGRRMCLGDVLARMERFLFFSCLLHVYNLELPSGESLPSMQGQTTGVSTTPDQCKVCTVHPKIQIQIQPATISNIRLNVLFLNFQVCVIPRQMELSTVLEGLIKEPLGTTRNVA